MYYTSSFPNYRSSLFDLIDRPLDILSAYDSKLEASRYATESTDSDYKIWLSLPGHDKESIKISFEAGKLLISADLPKETKKALCRSESFRFSLPKNCDPNEIEAKIENGILSVTIAKLIDKKLAKRIEVSVN